jgi:site-specific DNA recombinase
MQALVLNKPKTPLVWTDLPNCLPGEGEIRVKVRRGCALRPRACVSVRELAGELKAQGIRSKQWVNKHDRALGGADLSRGALYHLLSNHVYRGANRHKEKLYENAHAAIIDETLWAAVQARLADTNASRPPAPKTGEGALLEGLVRDDRGNDMVVTHTTRGTKRYRYYLSRPKITGSGDAGSLPRLSAGMLDSFLVDRIARELSPGWSMDQAVPVRVRNAITGVVLGSDRVLVTLRATAMATDTALALTVVTGSDEVELRLPLYIKRRQSALVLGDNARSDEPARKIDRALARAVVLARTWARQLESGEVGSVKELARRNDLCEHYTMRLAPLAYLAPDIASAIIEGRHPRALSLAALIAQPLPLEWDAQRRLVQQLG